MHGWIPKAAHSGELIFLTGIINEQIPLVSLLPGSRYFFRLNSVWGGVLQELDGTGWALQSICAHVERQRGRQDCGYDTGV